MAQGNSPDPARLERLERRLQALEDAEAIRNLKARYAALCDNQYDADGIAMLFTEDALWESPGLGRFEGREALRAGRLGGRDRKRKPRVPPLRRVLGAELTISFQPDVSLHLTHGKPKPKLRPDAEDSRPETTDGITRPAIAANLLINIPGNSSRNLL